MHQKSVTTQVRRENSELSKTRTRSPGESGGWPWGRGEVREQQLASATRAGSPRARAAWGVGSAASHGTPRTTLGFLRPWTCAVLVKLPNVCTKVPQRGIYCARSRHTQRSAWKCQLAGKVRAARALEPGPAFELRVLGQQDVPDQWPRQFGEAVGAGAPCRVRRDGLAKPRQKAGRGPGAGVPSRARACEA